MREEKWVDVSEYCQICLSSKKWCFTALQFALLPLKVTTSVFFKFKFKNEVEYVKKNSFFIASFRLYSLSHHQAIKNEFFSRILLHFYVFQKHRKEIKFKILIMHIYFVTSIFLLFSAIFVVFFGRLRKNRKTRWR